MIHPVSRSIPGEEETSCISLSEIASRYCLGARAARLTDQRGKQESGTRSKAGTAYALLLLYFFVYFGRPEDWIPGIAEIPLAKITGLLVLVALVVSVRRLEMAPTRELVFLLLLVAELFLSAGFSPVWRGGAIRVAFDFAKVLIVVFAVGAVVSTAKELSLLLFVQVASVSIVAFGSVLSGRMLVGRLEGALSGNYADPNDLALSIVITLPFCWALMFVTTNKLWKAASVAAMLVMTYVALMTGSRGGFLALIAVTAVSLWNFAIKRCRRYLFIPIFLACAVLWAFSSDTLVGRLKRTFESSRNDDAAYGSAQQRQELFWRSLSVTADNPVFGVGPGNFEVVSGNWHVTHNSFTQMSAEGGIPAFIFYVLVLVCGLRNVIASKRLAPANEPVALLACALQASLAGYIVGSSFVSVAYQFFPYILVAQSTALLYIARRSALACQGHHLVSTAASRLSDFESAPPNSGAPCAFR